MTDDTPLLLRCRPSTIWDRVSDLGWRVLAKIIGGITLLVASTLFAASGGLQYLVDLLMRFVG